MGWGSSLHVFTQSVSAYLLAPDVAHSQVGGRAAADCKFNSVLVNRYENEKDSVGWHADNEPQMSHEHPIASLSLGATRRFEMRKGILSRRLNWSMEACCHGTRNAKGMETPSTQN